MKNEPMPPKGNPELYKKAVELHKQGYWKPKYDKEKYDKKLGHMVQRLFGKGVWTLKDLDDAQLLEVMKYAEIKVRKIKKFI